MSPLGYLLTVTLLCNPHSASMAQSTDYSTLTMFFTINTTVHSTLKASFKPMANRSTTPGPIETGSTNTTVPLNGSSTTQSETPSDGGLYTTHSVGQTQTTAIRTENSTQLPSPTAESRPTASPHGLEQTRSSAVPSRKPGVPSPVVTETLESTTQASCENSVVSGEDDPETKKRRQIGKTLGVFIGLAVVLLLVFGLVYLIYNRTQKDDPFSHQRLYNSDPGPMEMYHQPHNLRRHDLMVAKRHTVYSTSGSNPDRSCVTIRCGHILSLDVSVEPPDRFYGSLTSDLGREGQGHHVMTQRTLNQSAGEAKDPASQPHARDEIQLKPMSESSVKIFL